MGYTGFHAEEGFLFMDKKRVLIIGGVACGAKTAARLARIAPHFQITVLERGEHLSFAGCGFPYFVGDVVKECKDLVSTPLGIIRDANFFRTVKNVTVHTGCLATKIDRERKRVTASDAATGAERVFPYDFLVLATGASPVRPPIPGNDLDRVFTLWTMPDALAMKSALGSGKVQSAVIIGAGLIGMEVVEALANRGISVSVVDVMPTPLPALVGEDFGLRIAKMLKQKGVSFFGGEKVTEIVGEGGGVTAVKTGVRTIPADMVLLAVGIRPNTTLAGESGLKLAPDGTLVVDDMLRTSDPSIYAGGDCVQSTHLITGKPVWQPMGSTANRHGRVIADNIAGLSTAFSGVLGTGILKLFSLTIGKTGLSEAQAREAGLDPVSIVVEEPDRPHFMPGMGGMTIRLIADKSTRKLLGAQIMGTGVVDKRLDALVAAISGGLTVDLLSDSDFAYAPPFSTALDPSTHAANSLKNKMDGLVRTYQAKELAERMEKPNPPLLLDVRTPGELDVQGRMPFEFVNIPLGKLRERLGELPRDRQIVAFCKISVRGWDAIAALKDAGFRDVALLEGGVMAWPYDLK